VAEARARRRRGYYTSFIQTTATLGFFLSLGVIGTCRLYSGPRPSAPTAGASRSSPPSSCSRLPLHPPEDERVAALHAAQARGRVSKNPLKESFGNKQNLKYVLLALFGATAGQGVVWYTGQFYALTFLQKPLNLDWKLAYILVSIALAPGHAVLRRLRRALRPHRAQSASCWRAASWRRSPTCRSTWPKALANPTMAPA
jgi:hypothetical protein